MEKHNTVHAIFASGAKAAEIIDDVWQYDFGQTLQIEGLSLPPTIEVHYANKGRDTAIPQVGVTKDGITTAPIPNEILSEKGAFTAYIFVTDGKSGETCYTITGYINKRPALKEFDTPEEQEILHAAVGAVNAAAERAESAEIKATAAANQTAKDAKQTAADREAVKLMVESVSGIGEQVVKVENLTKQAQTSATNAALSEQAAKTAETNAQAAQAGAETAEGNAELAERNVKASEAAVEKAKQLVTQMGQEVLDNKNHVDQTVQAFDQTAQQAVADVNNAGQTQTERVQSAGNTAVESVKTAQGTATQAVETAKTEAVKAVQTEGTTQTGNVTAEGAKQVQAVQAAAQEIVADREQIQKNKAGIEVLKQGKADAIVETTSGETIQIEDSSGLGFEGLRIFGKSTQDGVPSPENPVPIMNAGDKGIAKSEVLGGNLIDISLFEDEERSGISAKKTADGGYRLFGKTEAGEYFVGANVDSNLPPGHYYLSDKNINPCQNSRLLVRISNLETEVRYYMNGGFEIKEGDIVKYYFQVEPSQTIDITLYPMLNAGKEKIPYEPYREPQSLIFSTPNGLPGIKVDSGGNYTDSNGQQWVSDEIDLERGKYVQRIYKCKKEDLTIVKWSNNEYFIIASNVPIPNTVKALCNITSTYSSSWINKDYSYYFLQEKGQKVIIALGKKYCNSMEEMQKVLDVGIDFRYILKTPIEHDLPPEVIEAYKKLHTNYPVTTVLNDAGAGMKVEYVADTKHYIDKKFEELNAKVVNTQIALL